jgi:integrase
MVRLDLAAADIPYQDDDGRFFDFHALRGQFISLLAASGVHPKVAQVLARHSTINLTMEYYTHLDVFDVAGALDKLPRIAGQKPGEERRPA